MRLNFLLIPSQHLLKWNEHQVELQIQYEYLWALCFTYFSPISILKVQMNIILLCNIKTVDCKKHIWEYGRNTSDDKEQLNIVGRGSHWEYLQSHPYCSRHLSRGWTEGWSRASLCSLHDSRVAEKGATSWPRPALAETAPTHFQQDYRRQQEFIGPVLLYTGFTHSRLMNMKREATSRGWDVKGSGERPSRDMWMVL